MFGTISGDRANEITRAYVDAFVDRHLRGIPCSLLEALACLSRGRVRAPVVAFRRDDCADHQ
jgi:hypothetical protein